MLSDREQTKRQLIAAMKIVKTRMSIGSSNKVDDVQQSNGWSTEVIKLSQSGSYVSHTDRQGFKKWSYIPTSNNLELACELTPGYKSETLEPAIAKFIMNARYGDRIKAGNCRILSDMLALHLWKHKEKIWRIEQVDMQSFDHTFLIINRRGDLQDSTTWGPDAFVVDPWYTSSGYIYPGLDYLKTIGYIVTYAKIQAEALKPYGIHWGINIKGSDGKFKLLSVYEIKPQSESYPNLEKYINDLDKNISDAFTLSNDQQLKYKHCLFSIAQKKFTLSNTHASNSISPLLKS